MTKRCHLTRQWFSQALLALLLLANSGWQAAAAPVIQWRHNPAAVPSSYVEVSQLDADALQALAKQKADEWPSAFAIYAEQGDPTVDLGVPPMAGSYRLVDEGLRFEPRFPLTAGIRYRAVYKGVGGQSAGKPMLTEVFELPKPPSPGPATVVTQIYPSARALPENLLKFYLHFSQPMRRGHSYEFIQLLRENGEPVELPFLELAEELWNPALTRLTVLIDPGRIKTGVRPLEEIGPALEAGHRFTLRVDRGWQDARGRPLADDFEKQFQVVGPDRTPPDPKNWKLRSPSANTTEPLVVRFEKSLDHALAQRLIAVVDEAGAGIEGRATLSEDERVWSFTPASIWGTGLHRVVVQTTIEDLAGNNIGKPFEVDLFEKVDRELRQSSVAIPFEVATHSPAAGP